jgi:hypothetical protein
LTSGRFIYNADAVTEAGRGVFEIALTLAGPVLSVPPVTNAFKTKPCPECGHWVSVTALGCPNCGRKLKSELAGLLVAIITAIITGGLLYWLIARYSD